MVYHLVSFVKMDKINENLVKFCSTLERPTEKVRKSCHKPLKMRNISPPKFTYTKFRVLGTSGRCRTRALLHVDGLSKMSQNQWFPLQLH